MADNYAFAEGAAKYARAKKVGSFNGKDLVISYVGALTAPPTVAGFENLSVSSTAKLLTVPDGATHALVTVEKGGGDIRFREDGEDPTASVGLLVQAGAAVEFTNLEDIRLIATAGTVKVNISYRRYDK